MKFFLFSLISFSFLPLAYSLETFPYRNDSSNQGKGKFFYTSPFTKYQLIKNYQFIKDTQKDQEIKWPTPPMLKYKKTSKTRKNLSIIVLSGLSGAILGLSTISFSTNPGKASSNITMGFGIGVLFGSLFTLYKTITTHPLNKKSSGFYKNNSLNYTLGSTDSTPNPKSRILNMTQK